MLPHKDRHNCMRPAVSFCGRSETKGMELVEDENLASHLCGIVLTQVAAVLTQVAAYEQHFLPQVVIF